MNVLAKKFSDAGKKAWATRKARSSEAKKPKLVKHYSKPSKIELPPEAKTASVKDMMLQTTVFCLNFSGIGTRRQVDTDEFISLDEGVKKSFNTTKRLIECDELEEISSLCSKMQREVVRLALPFHLKKGIYLMPRAFQEETETLLTAGVKDLKAIVAGMTTPSRYAEILRDNKKRLSRVKVGSQVKNFWDESQFPSQSTLKNSFTVEWQHLAVDSADGLSKKVHEQQKQRSEKLWSETADNIRQMLRQQLRGLVDHMVDRLSPNEHNEPKMFKEATFDRFNNFLAALPHRNITNDTQLIAMGEETKALLKTCTADQLRSDGAFRKHILEGFENISQTLEGMVETKHHRSIELAD